MNGTAHKLDLYIVIGDRAFSYFGPSVWYSLPLHIRNATAIDIFGSALKKNNYLFNLQESD